MRLIRKTGFSDTTDPRQQKYAVYSCDGCKHTEYYNVTYNFKFDYGPKRCPKCGSISSEEYLESIKQKINSLTEEKSRIEIQIEKLITELETKEKEIVNAN